MITTQKTLKWSILAVYALIVLLTLVGTLFSSLIFVLAGILNLLIHGHIIYKLYKKFELTLPITIEDIFK